MKRTEVHSESPTALRSTQNKIPTKGFKPLMGIQYGAAQAPKSELFISSKEMVFVPSL